MSELTPAAPDWRARVEASFARQGAMRLLGATLGRMEPGLVEIELPYREELSQQHGFFHAGITSTIADSAGGYAGFSLFPADSTVLTTEYKMNLIAPADGERLTAQGKVLRHGRTLTICSLEVRVLRHGRVDICAVGLQTLMCLHGKPDRRP